MCRQQAPNPAPAGFRRAAALLSLLAVVEGCGGEGDLIMTETEKVSAAADLSDAAGNPDVFKSFFVDGAAPDDSQRLRYKGRGYTASNPKISGNSATMTVAVTDVATGEVLGEVEWTAEKVGDEWKLKTAPLP